MSIPQPGYAPPAVGATHHANSLHTGHFGPHHVYQYPTSFFLRDKTIYSGNLRKGTTVHNPDGSVAFQTREAVLSLRNKEVVYDALGSPIASLHKKTISMHGTWQVFRGDSTSKSALVAEITPSLVNLGGKTIKVTLEGQDNPAFIVKGNFLARSFQFIDGNNNVIAESRRQGKFHSVSNYVSGEDTFTLAVQPGVDTALLVMVTLVIDDILEPAK
jgi:uncharacterized protein YxjI